jgi:hypothetical protein
MNLFEIMPGRYKNIQETIDGYRITDTPLIAFLGENEGFVPSAITEESGSSYYIPKLVELTGFELELAVQLFYGGIVGLAFFVGAIGSWKYCNTQIGKWVSLLALSVLSFVIAGISDIYVVMGASTISLVPWLFYLQKNSSVKEILIFCTIAGFIIGFSHSLRNHGGTGVLIVIIFSILFSKKYSPKIKVCCGAALMVGIVMISLFFGHIQTQRDVYLDSIKYDGPKTNQRVVWHNLYLSLGYLWNVYGYEEWPGHEPSDSYSIRKALSVNPEVQLFSHEYENILKHEYFKFIKDHPFFFINTIFAKLGVLLMYVLIFANIGLVLAIYYPQGYQFNLLFAVGIGFNMLFGLVGFPWYQYLMGLFAFAAFFGVFSIDHAVANGFLKQIKFSKKK